MWLAYARYTPGTDNVSRERPGCEEEKEKRLPSLKRTGANKNFTGQSTVTIYGSLAPYRTPSTAIQFALKVFKLRAGRVILPNSGSSSVISPPLFIKVNSFSPASL